MCGVAGAIGVPNAAEVVREMLLQMQDRGHEAAGIASWSGERMHARRGFGAVRQVFPDGFDYSVLPGTMAIGHNWYSTSAAAGIENNIQPLVADVRGIPTAVAHNGDIENYRQLYAKHAALGAVFQTTSDTELFLTIAARTDGGDFGDAIADTCAQVSGAYSTLFLRPGALYAVRDPLGVRPLLMAKCGNGRLFASESCAFGALTPDICAPVTDIRDVGEGCVVAAEESGALVTRQLGRPTGGDGSPRTAHCIFEYVYFARLRSVLNGVDIYDVRKKAGAAAGRAFMARYAELGIASSGDLIACAAPESGRGFGTGFVQETGIVFEPFLERNTAADRTFIQPGEKRRKRGVAVKIGIVASVVRGRRVVVVDDSIVRGNTMPQIVAMLFAAGATEVHVVIPSPPWIRRCTLGISTKTDSELFAVKYPTPDKMLAALGATSLTYLSIEDLYAAADDPERRRHCAMCMTGVHPLSVNNTLT